MLQDSGFFESIIRPWLNIIGLSNISITYSHSISSVSGEKTLNCKEDFMSTALKNWTLILTCQTQGLKNWKFGSMFFCVCQYRFAYTSCTQPILCAWITCASAHVCRSCMPRCTWLCTLHKYFPSDVYYLTLYYIKICDSC